MKEQKMVDKVKELLKQIDNIVTHEQSRLEDEIDRLQAKLKEITDVGSDYEQLKTEAKKIAEENKSLKAETEKLSAELQSLKDYKPKYEELEKVVEQKDKLLSGLRFTLSVITTWIPSQKENISLLLALASSPNYTSVYEDLSERTKIPVVTLRNRVVPLLKEKNLVIEEENKISLNITELSEDSLQGLFE